MTTADEQGEARSYSAARKNFPQFRWIGTLSRKEKRLRLFRVGFLAGLGPGYGHPENYNSVLSVGIEFKVQDCWTGAFWKLSQSRDELWVWICFVPLLPLRIHYRRSYGGWIMGPGRDPKVAKENRRRWWQIIKVL